MWLLLKRNIKEIFKNDENYTYIFPINKFNFFVGKNNSGKSYFMRFILNNYVKLYTGIEDVKISIINQVENLKIIPPEKNFKNEQISEVYNENVQLLSVLKEIIDTAREDRFVQYSNNIVKHKYENFYELKRKIKPLIKFLKYSENIYIDEEFLDTHIYPK